MQVLIAGNVDSNTRGQLRYYATDDYFAFQCRWIQKLLASTHRVACWLGQTGKGEMYGGDINNALQMRTGTTSKIRFGHRQTNDINACLSTDLAKSRVNDTQVIN